jgi:hypothetical protein
MSMMTSIFQGGEFYASNTTKHQALRAERQNSSPLQHWSINGAFSMLIAVAARLFEHPSFPFCPSYPSQRNPIPIGAITVAPYPVSLAVQPERELEGMVKVA